MVVTRSQADRAEDPERRRELEQHSRTEPRAARADVAPPTEPHSASEPTSCVLEPAHSVTTHVEPVPRTGAIRRVALRKEPTEQEIMNKTVVFQTSPATSRCSVSTAMRIRQAEREAEEKILQVSRRELELERQLIKSQLASRIEIIEAEGSLLGSVHEKLEPMHEVRDWLKQCDLNATPMPQAQPIQCESTPRPEPRVLTPKPAREFSENNGIAQLAEAIANLTHHRPPPRQIYELPSFTGDPSEWLPFQAAYNESTRAYSLTPVENMGRLRACLKGAAREAVLALLHTNTDPELVMQTLRQCYGRPEIIVDRALDDLKRLPRMGSSAADLNTFAVKVQNIVAVVASVDKRGYLNNPLLTREILDRMSPHMRSRFCDYAEDHSTTTDSEVVVLSKFLMREADRALRYTYTTAVPSTHAAAPPTGQELRPPKMNMGAVPRRANPVYTVEQAGACLSCGGSHPTTECRKLQALSVPARWEWAKQNKVCFKCLNKTHRRDQCRAKGCSAQGCPHSHHRLLHLEEPTSPTPTPAPRSAPIYTAHAPQSTQTLEPYMSVEAVTTTSDIAAVTATVLLKVVPVTISGPDGALNTYALLDEGSTVSLIEDDLAREIGATGPEAPLYIKGVGAMTQLQKSLNVEAFICSRTGGSAHRLKLRTVHELNLHQQQIKTSMLMNHAHLKGLNEACYNTTKPRVLIGADHWHLMVTKETRTGCLNEPAAALTELGWVIYGTVPSTPQTREFETTLHLTTKNEDELNQFIPFNFNVDSLGVDPKTRTRPRDELAEQIFQETVRRIDGPRSPVVGQLWRDNDPKLPPNLQATFKILMSLERKVDKNSILMADYSKQVENVLNKGYAERVVDPGTSPIQWCILYLKRAEHLWHMRSKREDFTEERKFLEHGGRVAIKNELFLLDPLQENERNPSVRLFILQAHYEAGHSTNERVINDLKQQYWIVHLRPTVCAVAHTCRLGMIRRANPPLARNETNTRPFTNDGVDYFSPLVVNIGQRHEKRWVALFTCLTTHAVHLEMAASLSTNSAIMALRRMAALRGWPCVIYSDNGTNFRGADSELRAAYKEWLPALREYAMQRHVEWRFICPGAPNQGGAWERLVRSIKTALTATLHTKAPKEEVLSTVLVQAEHTVNARPLTHVSIDPRDDEALTPNHFLLGASTRLPVTGPCEEADRRTWRASQALADHFWVRWIREYLPTLAPRRSPSGRERPLQIGDLVVVVDPALPRNVWPRGVVVKTYPGPDGGVRRADVRIKGGVLQRPTTKLAVLPVLSEAATGGLHRGENVTDGS